MCDQVLWPWHHVFPGPCSALHRIPRRCWGQLLTALLLRAHLDGWIDPTWWGCSAGRMGSSKPVASCGRISNLGWVFCGRNQELGILVSNSLTFHDRTSDVYTVAILGT